MTVRKKNFEILYCRTKNIYKKHYFYCFITNIFEDKNITFNGINIQKGVFFYKGNKKKLQVVSARKIGQLYKGFYKDINNTQ